MDQVGASRGLKRAFVLCAAAGFVGGAAMGLRLSNPTYTLQVGDEAWTSSSFKAERYIPGPPVYLSSQGLIVGGATYGVVADHAHVWVKDDGSVFVNNARVEPR